MAKLTKKERAWLDELQAVLNRCPSKRLGFFTIGDPILVVYDRTKDAEIDKFMDRNTSAEFCTAVQHHDAEFTTIDFPAAVHSTCG
ncbi:MULTISPECIES: hypothetical protein [Dickeya]|uniref:hypothetical protein n=1 Tax=Dickeya TaxID=204037 RepID=UPI00039F18C5|nr:MULTISPECIES: hypothetical protein [Dickeya]MCI4031493.1 hypothetical protein [Dickeya dianthicola]MCI4174581.1 hypothetical protein [Dickeya dianthicola]MCI4179559.1 hypothetical protein [Dickeya dianthicola]MCI4180334.1 hypothetical protein [Dickeya dianthicola]MCI4194067.1 hypothetical protein [Dickeya dianthicola]